jgi:hypothetical protein
MVYILETYEKEISSGLWYLRLFTTIIVGPWAGPAGYGPDDPVRVRNEKTCPFLRAGDTGTHFNPGTLPRQTS